jgi:hypothetical protein
MPLPRYELDATSQFFACSVCGAKDVELSFSPLSPPAQEVIGFDNKACHVAIPKVVCPKCLAIDRKPKARAAAKAAAKPTAAKASPTGKVKGKK